MNDLSWMIPVRKSSGHIGKIHMIRAVVLDDLRRPERITGIGAITNIGGIHIFPLRAVIRFGNADARTMAPSYAHRIIRSSATVSIKHPPFLFCLIPDHHRVGGAIIYGIAKQWLVRALSRL